MSGVEGKQSPALPQTRRRRRVFPVVDARFQFKYAGLVAAVGVVCSSVLGLLLLDAHRENTALLSLGASSIVVEEAQRSDQYFLLYLVLGIILTGLALMAAGMLITHRMAGPLFLARRYLAMLGQGVHPDLRPIRTRDEFREFYQALTKTCESLAMRDRRNLRELEELVTTVKRLEDSMLPEDYERTLKQVTTMRDQLKSSFEE